MNSKITFIGAGNMTRAIIVGLIADGVGASSLTAANHTTEKLEYFQQQFGVNVSQDNQAAAAAAQVIVLAVKPQQMKEVCQQLQDVVNNNKPLIISIAAGVSIEQMERWFGDHAAIIRAMPNLASMVKAGATALSANGQVELAQRNVAESIFEAVGITAWVQEEQLNAITALSGSGPAYFFLFMDFMQQAATQLGLEPDIAKLFTLQTALGAAKIAVESDLTPAQLRESVTSKNGTTAAALSEFAKVDLAELFQQAMAAAASRAQTLSDSLKEE